MLEREMFVIVERYYISLCGGMLAISRNKIVKNFIHSYSPKSYDYYPSVRRAKDGIVLQLLPPTILSYQHNTSSLS